MWKCANPFWHTVNWKQHRGNKFNVKTWNQKHFVKPLLVNIYVLIYASQHPTSCGICCSSHCRSDTGCHLHDFADTKQLGQSKICHLTSSYTVSFLSKSPAFLGSTWTWTCCKQKNKRRQWFRCGALSRDTFSPGSHLTEWCDRDGFRSLHYFTVHWRN